MIALVSANLINVLANWLLIFGNLGAPQLGVDGAAWATCASRVYLALFLLLAASFVHKFIGNTGASVISRVMGIVLATIAVDSVLGGLAALDVLDLAPPPVENPITQPATG